MPDTVELDRDLGVIDIRSFGNVTTDDIAGSITECERILEKEGISQILVDTREQETLPNMSDLLALFSNFPICHLKSSD